MEICVGGKCVELNPKNDTVMEFDSAGIQNILVKIHVGSITLEQKLSLEVR